MSISLSFVQKKLDEYLLKGEDFLVRGYYTYAMAYLYRALGLAELLNNEKNIISIYIKILGIVSDKGDTDLVIKLSDELLHKSLSEEIKAVVLDYKIYNLIQKGDFNQTQNILLQFLINSDQNIQRVVCSKLGLLYVYLFKYLKINYLQKGESYLQKALQLAEQEEDENICGQVNFYIALLKTEEELFYKGREHLLLALSKVPGVFFKIKIINELGKVSIKLLDFDSAEEYLNLAKKLAEDCYDQLGLSYNFYYRGLFYLELMQTELAHNYLLIALSDFLKKGFFLEGADVCLALTQLFHGKNSEKEKHYFREYERCISKIK